MANSRFDKAIQELCKELGLTDWGGGDDQGFGGEDVPREKSMKVLRERLLPLLEILARFTGNPPWDDLHEDAEKELARWLK